ncbi:Gamma-tubulin complex component 6 [Morella rubra]|uniref:Gamma-tubulin complex component 6 n=1 Tax=Morella rubra TaxID=262757 RepID=A0A6A1WSU6_9ROSI|nr:Gamma-tubulin complex component 6 [Morella rubra]
MERGMAVDANFASLFEKLKVEDPWLPPRTWESIPSESGRGGSRSLSHFSSSSQTLSDASTVSEESLVRLAMHAMQGVESALISIEKLSAAFCSEPADRTFHQIPSLWNRSSSTHALGRILNSIGCSGSLVFLLWRFVDYFSKSKVGEGFMEKRDEVSEPSAESQNPQGSELHGKKLRPYSLVNQAFAVAVGKVLEGYMGALDTLYASVSCRRSSRNADMPLHAPSMAGCLTSVVNSEITILELYMHTKELRTQIEALGNICNLDNRALCFSTSSFEDLIAKATFEFCNFCRGGDLLTHLYKLLQVADPAHCAVLKFLFLRSCEPYCGFIRSWIFKAEISDPYKEFIVEYSNNLQLNPHGKAGISVDFPLAIIRERDAVAIPCFLEDFLIPLVRAGQQLQVIMKLLEWYIYVVTRDHTYDDILPRWSGFSSSYLSYASPVTFCKANIEAMVLERESYYKMLLEKVECTVKKLEFRYEQFPLQVIPHCTGPVCFGNGGGCSNNPDSLIVADSSMSPLIADERRSNVAVSSLDCDDSSSVDELSYGMDTYQTSDCLSSNSSEEQIDSEQLIEPPNQRVGLQSKYLSALSFSLSTTVDISLQKSDQFTELSHKESHSGELWELTKGLSHDMHSHHKGLFSNHPSVLLESGESHWSCMSDIRHSDNPLEKACLEGCLQKVSFSVSQKNRDDSGLYPMDSDRKLRKRNVEVMKEVTSHFGEILATLDSKDQCENHMPGPDTYTLQQLNPTYHSNFLSMNPVLTNYAYLHLMSKSGERCSSVYEQSLPYFDFNSVEDPCKSCVERLSASSVPEFGSDLPLTLGSHASSACSKSDHHGSHGCDAEHVLIDNTGVGYSPSTLKDHSQEVKENVSGGSNWETLLGSSSEMFNTSAEDRSQGFSATFEIPLDFIIEKCILQEIILQYKYISKLTIKLFEEGFALHGHFRALRRYHFMEVADWADLFIKKLWHHPQKWCVTEQDQRLSEIQGVLELSVQRSSCERDPHKDRLFVYMKGHRPMPLSTSTLGVHAFNFLGLGYRVDWPLSIVLTPGALQIYAEIFSFLIQVKLAVFSLTDVWCSLKDLVQCVNRNRTSEHPESEVSHFNILMKLRHQVNHFVCTLQQYVESQLSHVSWCRFLHSLHNKVKDMLDLESVHMAYLMDSLHICFLSDETRHIASKIENILQCALDFRFCLTGGMGDIGIDQGDLMAKLSRINISQVLAIKRTFERNLKELHLCYLKSPKNREFGLSPFWAYLNYNEFYSDNGNEMTYYAFSV